MDLFEETYLGFVWNLRFCAADGVSCVVFFLWDIKKDVVPFTVM